MATIINGIEFNSATDITFTKPKVNASGGKNIGVLNSKTMKGMYLNTPLMLTWGINEYKDDNTGKLSYDMSLQFPNDEYNTPELTQFLKNMRDFENKIKKSAIENSKEWMNKSKLSAEVVDALWTPMLKYPKDKTTGEPDYSRAPTIKVKIPFWEGVIKNVEVYNTNEELVFPQDDNLISDYIVKGSNVATIIQCGGIWFANGKFGMTWRLFQCMVKPRQSLAGKCHVMISDTEREKLVVESEKDAPEEGNDGGEVEVVADTDDEEDIVETTSPKQNPEPEPEPEPEPVKETVKELQVEDVVKPKKKVVKKKKSVEAEAEA